MSSFFFSPPRQTIYPARCRYNNRFVNAWPLNGEEPIAIMQNIIYHLKKGKRKGKRWIQQLVKMTHSFVAVYIPQFYCEPKTDYKLLDGDQCPEAPSSLLEFSITRFSIVSFYLQTY